MTRTVPTVAAGPQALAAPPRTIESAVLHMAGVALLFTAAGLAASLAVDAVSGGGESPALAASTALTAGAGAVLRFGTRLPRRVPTASAFAAVSWTWILVSAFGALPYVLSGVLPRVDDALFESVSGFTATGSTVISPLEGQSLGLLFWRQLTQWYGGMGMIVLAVAVLPFLGVGGLELIRAEAPGETSDRLAPRVSGTAKRLWVLYVGLTAAVALALLLTGRMAPLGGGVARSVYDAVVHAMTAVATGGYSPYDRSVLTFDSHAVELVLIAGMLLGATSFTLHWRAVRGDPASYLRSSELRLYVGVVVAATGLIALLNAGDGQPLSGALRDASFNVVSLLTTCGFGTVDFTRWVPAAQLVLLLLMASGGMVGSTSGAMKLFRVRIVAGHAWRELRRARHPRAVLTVRLDHLAVPEQIVARVAGFVLVYVVIAIAGMFALAALGESVATSAGSVLTAMGGVGPGLDETGPAANFLAVTRPSRGVLMVLMLLGRLEIFPMLLMFAALARRRPRRRATAPGRGGA